MKFYEIPTGYEREIDAFEQSIEDFLAGRLHPTRFRAIRVPFGVYEQRTKETFMVRIRATAGGVTPDQLLKTAELANKYGKPLIHITTRQALQLHDLNLPDIPIIMRELLTVGLSSRGGGGNTVRNIMASYDSGVNPEEIFDVTPHAVALGSRLIAEDDSWSFARKFKVSFSSSKRDNALAAFNDLGFIAEVKGGRRGFKVFVAGGLGCRPRLSKVLHEFIEEDSVYHVCSAIKNLYLEHGNRKTKNSGRLRFLWEELGKDKFLEIYRQEKGKAEQEPPLSLDLTTFESPVTGGDTPLIQAKVIEGEHFKLWQKNYVSEQKQPSLRSVTIPLDLGDISYIDAVKLSRFLNCFGDNSIRLTMSQNIHIRNLPVQYLGNLFELVNEISTLSHMPKLCGEIIGCTGANTCTTGVCLPQGVVPVIQRYLLNSGLTSERVQDVRLHISGCPNSCGQHHVGDLGFYGRIARKGGKTLPGYWVTGGSSIDPASRAFGEKCGWVAAKDLPQLVVQVLTEYDKKTESSGGFNDYFHNGGGRQHITELCTKFSEQIPTFEQDKNYYYDWGAGEEFTTAHMGHGECSAGIYDMIEVSMKSIKECLKQKIDNNEQRQKTSQELVYGSASMLLVTRGLDPVTEFEIFDAFLHHFIDKGLVEERFRPLVQAARTGDKHYLAENFDAAKELGEVMIQLYHNMDNRLKFKCEEACENVVATSEDRLKDLRGVACPMNFVKTKVELAKIEVGARLQIMLDDGEPIDNVPRSVKTEGHAVISQRKVDGHWLVIIEKKA